MIQVCPNKLMQYANRECNAIMTIATCTNTAASSNDSNHHSSTPAAWFASGTAYHGRRYQNLGSWTSWRSYTIVVNMSSLDDIVTIVEFHRRRWKPPASLTISLTKSLRVAGSFVRSAFKLPRNMVLLHGAIITWCYSVFRNQLFCKYLQTIFKLENLKNV